MPVQQVWLYHPVLAPEGNRFYSDDMPPRGSGWVDDPSKFQPYDVPKPPSRMGRQQIWIFHPVHGKQLAWSNEPLPRGWTTDREKAEARRQVKEWATRPELQEFIDEWMKQAEAEHDDEDEFLNNVLEKRKAARHYAAKYCGLELDPLLTLGDMRDKIHKATRPRKSARPGRKKTVAAL